MSASTEETEDASVDPQQPVESAEAVHGVLEIAANGRARCRACGQALVKGEWRLGERAHNPFGEGETTYWFHVSCAAVRRPEVLLAALPEHELPAAVAPWLDAARFGKDHRRAARFAAVGVAPSGRARCRHCRELIEKGDVRIELSIFKDGRFDPMGYLHTKCLTSYVGAQVPFERLAPLCEALTPEQRQTLADACALEPVVS